MGFYVDVLMYCGMVDVGWWTLCGWLIQLILYSVLFVIRLITSLLACELLVVIEMAVGAVGGTEI